MSPSPAPTSYSSRALVVLTLSLLLPVILSIVVFPTPMYDTRELIAWGRQFPMVTPDHPPMMSWIGGGLDWLFGPSGAVMILAGQVLMAVGLWHFDATLRVATTRANAALFTFLYGTSFYTVFAPLSFALNADLLQLTSWPAVVFHGLRASRSRRLGHWIAFGVWSAAAILTKYNAVVLLGAMAVATLTLRPYRHILKDPGFYAALAIAAALVTPHGLAVYQQHAAVTYALSHFDVGEPLAKRLDGLGELGLGHMVSFLPGAVIVLVGVWKGVLVPRRPQPDAGADERAFLLVMCATMQIVLVGLVLIGGLDYVFRFSPPYVMMTVLALAPCVAWSGDCGSWVRRRVIPDTGAMVLAVGAVLMILYTFFASHSTMQEPTALAARTILDDWHRTYSCGPGYFLGGRQGVYGLGIEAGRDMTTLGYMDIAGAPWFEPARLYQSGAVVIDAEPDIVERMAKYLPGIAAMEERSFTLPLLRTHKDKRFTYRYHFIPPHNCGT